MTTSAVVSIVLATAVAVAGATQTLNGWPVASYPDFAYRVPDRIGQVELKVDEAGATPAAGPRAGLGSIAQSRFLYRALSDRDEFAQLRAAVADEFHCDPHPGSTVWIEYAELAISNRECFHRRHPT